jgi:hypothetical protein
MTFFVFFYFIHKKYLIIKFFFIKNVPINYPSLSKNRAKLSKNCPLILNRYEKSEKNLKKIQKIRFFHFFAYGLIPVFIKSRVIIYLQKLLKKRLKKKSKKKWFSFLQTFFLKSILDIFLCPISKLKKKFWKIGFFPLFDLFSTLGNYYLSPENQYFMFFLRNLHFGGNFL